MKRARIFYLNNEGEFLDFIRDSLSRSDDGRIENRKLTVSASLQKSLRSVFRNKDFFAPMERQKNTTRRS